MEFLMPSSKIFCGCKQSDKLSFPFTNLNETPMLLFFCYQLNLFGFLCERTNLWQGSWVRIDATVPRVCKQHSSPHLRDALQTESRKKQQKNFRKTNAFRGRIWWKRNWVNVVSGKQNKKSSEIQRVSTERATSESFFCLLFLQVGMELQQIDRGSYYLQFAFRW